MRRTSAVACLAVLLTAAACTENESAERIVEESAKRIVEESAKRIVGSWVIDEAAQREEVARVSPSELENFDEAFRMSFSSIRETFHRDGRYEITSPLGGPFDDRWELVSEDATSVTKTHERSASVLTYTFSDPDHMVVTTRIPLFGEEKEVSYFFVRGE